MKVVIKNFFRNEMAKMTLKSVKHFMPSADVHIVSLYKKDRAEYTDSFSEFASASYRQTKYHGMGSAVANAANGLFFSEGYNFIGEIFKDCDEKVLMLAEDHFFTTGTTLKELEETEFDIASAPWDSPMDRGANGSLLCIRPKRVSLPIPETHIPIEGLLQRWIDSNKVNIHRLSTRAQLDYKGDGFYTNNEREVEVALKQAGIL